MRRVRLSEIQDGMVLWDPVLNEQGRILVPAGSSVSRSVASKLASLGIHAVGIDDPRFRDVRIQESIAFPTKEKGLALMRQMIQMVAKAPSVDAIELPLPKIQDLLRDIEDDMSDSRGNLVHLIGVSSPADYWAVDALNSCLLALGMNKILEIGRSSDLAWGALLHDIGIFRLPKEILDKRDALDTGERQQVNTHPQIGAQILQNGASAHAKLIVAQHHERWDGSGYPKGLKGEEIYPMARLMAIVDVYTAAISPRPWRPPISSAEALELIMGGAGFEFDHRMVQAFLRCVTPYPIGSTVRLSGGQMGVVIRINEALPGRPVIRVYEIPGQGDLGENVLEIDLSSREYQTELIAEVVA